MFELAKNGESKLCDIFLKTEWFKRNFRLLSTILPLNFLEISNIFKNYCAFKISADFRT